MFKVNDAVTHNSHSGTGRIVSRAEFDEHNGTRYVNPTAALFMAWDNGDWCYACKDQLSNYTNMPPLADPKPIPAPNYDPADMAFSSKPADTQDEWPVGTRVLHHTTYNKGTVCSLDDHRLEWPNASRHGDCICIRWDSQWRGIHYHSQQTKSTIKRIAGYTPTNTPGDEPTDEKEATMNQEPIKFTRKPVCPKCKHKGSRSVSPNAARLNADDSAFEITCSRCGHTFPMLTADTKPPKAAKKAARAENAVWVDGNGHIQSIQSASATPLYLRPFDFTTRLIGRIIFKTAKVLIVDTFREGVKGMQRTVGTVAVLGTAIYAGPMVYEQAAIAVIESGVLEWPGVSQIAGWFA